MQRPLVTESSHCSKSVNTSTGSKALPVTSENAGLSLLGCDLKSTPWNVCRLANSTAPNWVSTPRPGHGPVASQSTNMRFFRSCGIDVLCTDEILHFVHLQDDTLDLAAFLACLVFAEHIGMEGHDALDGNVAGGATCREVGQQGADDFEMSIKIDPVDGEDEFLALVIDPGRREARSSM